MDLHQALNLTITVLNIALLFKNTEDCKYIKEQRNMIFETIQSLSTVACKLDKKIDGTRQEK